MTLPGVIKINEFEYNEDMQYFDNVLGEYGGTELNIELFDFRDPGTKRKEFNKIRNKVFGDLYRKYGSVCHLKCHKDCTSSADEVDHLIPLSSNALNKQLRGLKAINGKKAPTQSFGSNNAVNFVLACTRCNAFKKNKIPSKEWIARVFGARERH